MIKNLVISGSTGSIGVNTLSVVNENLDKFNVYGLVVKNNIFLMLKQCMMFKPPYVCMIDEYVDNELKYNLNIIHNNIKVLSGFQGVCELSGSNKVDIVMSSMVGVAGVLPTIAALRTSKCVLLVNKETLFVCGKIFMNELRTHDACLLPIDSEHSAIFQLLPFSLKNKIGRFSLQDNGISKIILTGSSGPLRMVPLDQLIYVTPEQACSYSHWLMGKKISVDSATMMNKGLEYIEVRLMFNASYEQIEILLHSESIIHFMVSYVDGSTLAQCSVSDIRVSIAHALSYPKRMFINVASLNLLHLKMLNFLPLDYDRYPCLKLAIYVNKLSQSATIIMNAVNEVAVEAFLKKNIKFTEIPDIIQRVLDIIIISTEPKNIEEILFIDNQAREYAALIVKNFIDFKIN